MRVFTVRPGKSIMEKGLLGYHPMKILGLHLVVQCVAVSRVEPVKVAQFRSASRNGSLTPFGQC